MKRVYIAGPLHRAAEARELAASLRAEGHDVVSRWHVEGAESVAERTLSRHSRQGIAGRNLLGLSMASHFILLADSRCRGSLAEAGFAIARAMSVLIVGDWREHTLMLDTLVFASITWVPSSMDAVQALRSEAA